MPRFIPLPVRQAIYCRFHKGQDVSTIAQALRLSPRTVRHLVHNMRQQTSKNLLPAYERCGRPAFSQPPPLVQHALDLRHDHPSWGAGLIRVLLRQQHPQATLPSERTLQRWFRRSQQTPAPPGRRPAAAKQRANTPHEVWQMDAVEQLPLRTGKQLSWLRLIDECSGAVLETVVFPPPVLETGSGGGRASLLAPGFWPLGTPPAVACG